MPSRESNKNVENSPVIAHAEFFAAALALGGTTIPARLGRGRPGELFYVAQYVIIDVEAQSFWGYNPDCAIGDRLMRQLLAMGFKRVEACSYGPYSVRYAP